MFKTIILTLIGTLMTHNSFAKEIPKGYLLFAVVETYEVSKFRAISTEEEAGKIFSNIKYDMTGVLYLPLYYSNRDMDVHYRLAKIAKKYRIDLWGSSFKLVERIRAFGDIKPEYQAYVMNEGGSIVPAVTGGRPLFDVLNEDAVLWFIKQYRTRYLEKMKSLLRGYLFDEDVLTYLGDAKNNKRYDYWNNPVYSVAVLKKWREYAAKHNVRYNSEIVDKFPVHKREMVSKGNGLTAYYPGYSVPEEVKPGQRFINLPRPEGVWRHWYDFICELFINNWIGQLAKVANEVNKDNPNWYGVIYLGLHHGSLPYEKIVDKDFTVPTKHRWGAWGRQRGIDLELLSKCPGINYVICATYPPIEANLEFFIKEYKRIVDLGGKIFGLMLHRDDKWKLNMEEEKKRWVIIGKYKPRILVRYPLKSIFTGSEYYSEEGEKYFSEQLEKYRISSD
jgi:hypothetical protein